MECARSVETTRRSQLGDAAGYGYCASHSRFFWGFRLHALVALDGTSRAMALTSPKIDEKTVWSEPGPADTWGEAASAVVRLLPWSAPEHPFVNLGQMTSLRPRDPSTSDSRRSFGARGWSATPHVDEPDAASS